MSRLILIGLIMALTGCSSASRQCSDAIPYVSGVGGDAGFDLAIQVRDAPRDKRYGRLHCVDVAVFDATSYADTLAHAKAAVVDGQIRIRQLPAAEVDIVIHQRGYFPTKIPGVQLSTGKRLLENRLIVYPSDAPVTLPGQFVVDLKPGSSLEDISSVYSVFDGVEVTPQPRSYHLQITSFDNITTRTDGERLAKALAESPFVESVAAVTNFHTVY